MRWTLPVSAWIGAVTLLCVAAFPAYASSPEELATASDSEESSPQAPAEDDKKDDTTAGEPKQVAVDPQTGQVLGPAPDDWVERRWALDLNLDGGLSRRSEQLGFLARGRGGITRIDGPYAISLGATAEVGTETTTTFGLELDLLSLHLGLFGQLGGGVDLNGNPVATMGGGWQIIGVEAQYRTTPEDPDTYGWTGIMKLRVPVSWLIRAARR